MINSCSGTVISTVGSMWPGVGACTTAIKEVLFDIAHVGFDAAFLIATGDIAGRNGEAYGGGLNPGSAVEYGSATPALRCKASDPVAPKRCSGYELIREWSSATQKGGWFGPDFANQELPDRASQYDLAFSYNGEKALRTVYQA